MRKAKAKVVQFPNRNELLYQKLVKEEEELLMEEMSKRGIGSLLTDVTASNGLVLTFDLTQAMDIRDALNTTTICLTEKTPIYEVIEEIKNLSRWLPVLTSNFKGYSSLCVAMDNNILKNYKTYKHYKNLSDQIHEHFPEIKIYFLQWDEEEIDRLPEIIKKRGLDLSKEELDRKVDKGLEELLEKYKVSSPENLHPILFSNILK